MSTDIPGWYGKLASLGDFAHRRLQPTWLQACDAWLTRALQGSQQQLGSRWLDTYLTAPVLRFAWAPGIVDTQWWFGLLMPSCDNVGRYFPLLIACPRARAPVDRIALDHLELWYEHVAQAALRTLREQGSVEALEEALAELPPWPTPSSAAVAEVVSAAHAVRYRLAPRASLTQGLQRMSADHLQARLAGCSLWWRPADDGTGDLLTVLQGLPDPAAFVELLEGAAAAG